MLAKYDGELVSGERCLATGAGGLIGSHRAEALLRSRQSATGLDNTSTDHHRKGREVQTPVGPHASRRSGLVEGEVWDFTTRPVQAASSAAQHSAFRVGATVPRYAFNSSAMVYV